jgi:hypothetical protein
LLQLNHDITGLYGRLDAVTKTFDGRDSPFKIAYSPGILSVTVDPERLPDLDKQLNALTAQSRQK